LFIFIILHTVLCLSLIALVLVQQGKGADMGAIMGSGSDSILGSSSAGNFISKLTTALAILFMIASIFLAKSYQDGSFLIKSDSVQGSVVDFEKAPAASQEVASPEVAAEEPKANLEVKDGSVTASANTVDQKTETKAEKTETKAEKTVDTNSK